MGSTPHSPQDSGPHILKLRAALPDEELPAGAEVVVHSPASRICHRRIDALTLGPSTLIGRPTVDHLGGPRRFLSLPPPAHIGTNSARNCGLVIQFVETQVSIALNWTQRFSPGGDGSG
jgi:hypothetical protein